LQIEVYHAADTERNDHALVLVEGEDGVYLVDEHLSGALWHSLDEVLGNLKASAVFLINNRALVGFRVVAFDDKLARHILYGHVFQAFVVLWNF
jgi:hypothetical protein